MALHFDQKVTIMSNKSSRSYYETAIALNNHGVRFLLHQQKHGRNIQYSKLSLRNALKVMKLFFMKSDEESSDDVQEALQPLICNLDQPDSYTAAKKEKAENDDEIDAALDSHDTEEHSETTSNINLRLLSGDTTLSSLSQAALEADVLGVNGDDYGDTGEENDPLFLNAIIIENSNDSDDDLNVNVEPSGLDLAIILNNLGVASQYSDLSYPNNENKLSPRTDERGVCRAYEFYNMAYDLLANMHMSMIPECCVVLIIKQRHIILLLIIVLQNLVQLSLQLHYPPDEVHEYYREICTLRTTYRNMETLALPLRRSSAPAA